MLREKKSVQMGVVSKDGKKDMDGIFCEWAGRMERRITILYQWKCNQSRTLRQIKKPGMEVLL